MSREELEKRVPFYMAPFDPLEQVEDDHKIPVACSISHFNDQMKKSKLSFIKGIVIETCEPVEIKRIGGAGNKCCSVAKEIAEAYMHPSPGLKYWDLCASESIVKAMGGYATHFTLERITYFKEGNRLIKGLVLARNKSMYDLILKRLGSLLHTIKGKFV